jgi:hypothetical protein
MTRGDTEAFSLSKGVDFYDDAVDLIAERIALGLDFSVVRQHVVNRTGTPRQWRDSEPPVLQAVQHLPMRVEP